MNTSLTFHSVHGIFLVSWRKCKFKDAQTPARLVECQVGKPCNVFSTQLRLLINRDPIFKGTSYAASASMLPRLLSSWNCFFLSISGHQKSLFLSSTLIFTQRQWNIMLPGFNVIVNFFPKYSPCCHQIDEAITQCIKQPRKKKKKRMRKYYTLLYINSQPACAVSKTQGPLQIASSSLFQPHRGLLPQMNLLSQHLPVFLSL